MSEQKEAGEERIRKPLIDIADHWLPAFAINIIRPFQRYEEDGMKFGIVINPGQIDEVQLHDYEILFNTEAERKKEMAIVKEKLIPLGIKFI